MTAPSSRRRVSERDAGGDAGLLAKIERKGDSELQGRTRERVKKKKTVRKSVWVKKTEGKNRGIYWQLCIGLLKEQVVQIPTGIDTH